MKTNKLFKRILILFIVCFVIIPSNVSVVANSGNITSNKRLTLETEMIYNKFIKYDSKQSRFYVVDSEVRLYYRTNEEVSGIYKLNEILNSRLRNTRKTPESILEDSRKSMISAIKETDIKFSKVDSRGLALVSADSTLALHSEFSACLRNTIGVIGNAQTLQSIIKYYKAGLYEKVVAIIAKLAGRTILTQAAIIARVGYCALQSEGTVS